MTRVIKKPSTVSAFISRFIFYVSGKAKYNQWFTLFFSIEDFKRLMMLRKLLRQCTGKYMHVEYGLLPDTSYDAQISGCLVSLYYELEEETITCLSTSDDNFSVGSANYSIQKDGLYLTNSDTALLDLLKRRNKLEKQYS